MTFAEDHNFVDVHELADRLCDNGQCERNQSGGKGILMAGSSGESASRALRKILSLTDEDSKLRDIFIVYPRQNGRTIVYEQLLKQIEAKQAREELDRCIQESIKIAEISGNFIGETSFSMQVIDEYLDDPNDSLAKKVGDPKEWRHKQKKRPWN